MVFLIQSTRLRRSATVMSFCSVALTLAETSCQCFEGGCVPTALGGHAHPGFALSVLSHPANTPGEPRADCVKWILPTNRSFYSTGPLPAPTASKESATLPNPGISPLSFVATFLPFCDKFQIIKTISSRDTIYTGLFQLCASSRRRNASLLSKASSKH